MTDYEKIDQILADMKKFEAQILDPSNSDYTRGYNAGRYAASRNQLLDIVLKMGV